MGRKDHAFFHLLLTCGGHHCTGGVSWTRGMETKMDGALRCWTVLEKLLESLGCVTMTVLLQCLVRFVQLLVVFKHYQLLYYYNKVRNSLSFGYFVCLECVRECWKCTAYTSDCCEGLFCSGVDDKPDDWKCVGWLSAGVPQTNCWNRMNRNNKGVFYTKVL